MYFAKIFCGFLVPIHVVKHRHVFHHRLSFLKSFICDAKIKWGHKEGIRLNIQKMSGEHFNDGCIYIIVRTVSVFERAGS